MPYKTYSLTEMTMSFNMPITDRDRNKIKWLTDEDKVHESKGCSQGLSAVVNIKAQTINAYIATYEDIP